MKQGEPLSGVEDNQTNNTQSSAGYTLGGASISLQALSEPDLKPGTIVDDFIVLKKIGPGGCGVVYKAQQKSIAREVALKLIRPGMAAQGVIKRFENEKETLGALNHPNIVNIIAYGKTSPELGCQPYFAMEYVSGLPITKYCEKNKLSVHDRLQLFVQVCEAVDHAHLHEVIHRDIKPANVLVTDASGKPVVKVIDFGIAKAVNNGLSTEYATQTGLPIGTPAYMSPEQTGLVGATIDARTDIYSLGVVLYELLVGCLHFPADKLARDKFSQTLREENPLPPSTRFENFEEKDRLNISRNRKTRPSSLISDLRGGVDKIVLKCLGEKQECRYETVSDLVADIQQFYKTRRSEDVKPQYPKTSISKSEPNNKVFLIGLLVLFAVAIAFFFRPGSGRKEVLTNSDTATPDGIIARTIDKLNSK